MAGKLPLWQATYQRFAVCFQCNLYNMLNMNNSWLAFRSGIQPAKALHNNMTPRANHTNSTIPMPHKILIVDDEAAILLALERLLTLENYQVLTAATAQEALQRVNDHQIALALVDLNLPDTTGWDVCRQIETLSPATRVMIITAQPDQHLHPLANAIDGLMEKPLDLPTLLRTIHTLISNPTAGPERQEELAACAGIETCTE